MIYFCIPSRDEAATVGLLLWKIRAVLQDSPREYQLLVGDDASSDATSEVLEPYAKVLPLDVIRSDEHIGYAATVERLLREALRRSDRHKRDAAILIPADFTSDPEALPEFLRRLDSGADLVVGESDLQHEPDRWRRLVRRWAGQLLGRNARVEGIRDVTAGYMAIRLVSLRNAFRSRPERWLRLDGGAANAELLAWCAAAARRTESVPVTELIERHQRPHRHTPWEIAKGLWAARRELERPLVDPIVRRERSSKGTSTKEAA